MYKSFYSLAYTPFSKELKPSQAFPSESFSEALARLDYLKKTRGIGLLVGDPGAGKTFALRAFVDSLHPNLYSTLYFPLSTGTVMDFFRGIAIGLGENPTFRKVDLFHQIQHAIISSYKERKITPIIILDEMQLAKDLFLHDLSILFNFNMDSENPFILILAGLPHFKDKLTLNQNRPLAQRIVIRHKMEPLTKDEVDRYIKHHLELAGAKHPIFSGSSHRSVS